MDGAENTNEITVEGYSARYRAASTRLLKIEGSFVDDPADHGGATKFGISLRFLAAEGAFDEDGDGKADFDLDMDGDIDGIDIRKLTRGDAVFLYFRCFWQRLRADALPMPIGEMVFDQAVNGGVSAACKMLQRAINSCLLEIRQNELIRVDGQLGSATLAALNKVRGWPGVDVTEAYRDAVRERYRAIVRRWPDQQRFLKGWLARADQLGRS